MTATFVDSELIKLAAMFFAAADPGATDDQDVSPADDVEAPEDLDEEGDEDDEDEDDDDEDEADDTADAV